MVSISWLLTNLLAALLLPPLSGLLLLIIGWWSRNRHPLLARGMTAGGVLLLWVLALPVVGDAMLRTLEGDPVVLTNDHQVQAIVVLGGGRYRDAPEYGDETASDMTLERLRYAARLQRETGLPLLVTGGKPEGGALSEAETMRKVLADEFAVPVRWVEGASINTHESARLSAELLRPEGITHIVLVTHAWHMPRAERSFRQAGFDVLPAATRFHREAATLLDFLPRGYRESRLAIHEWLGLAWYSMRG